jgi:LysM repeat protein
MRNLIILIACALSLLSCGGAPSNPDARPPYELRGEDNNSSPPYETRPSAQESNTDNNTSQSGDYELNVTMKFNLPEMITFFYYGDHGEPYMKSMETRLQFSGNRMILTQYDALVYYIPFTLDADWEPRLIPGGGKTLTGKATDSKNIWYDIVITLDVDDSIQSIQIGVRTFYLEKKDRETQRGGAELGYQLITVTKGMSINYIATKYGISRDVILQLNPEIAWRENYTLRIGEKVKIPKK